MDTTPLCPECGKPLASNAPKGLCPECLLKAAFPTGADTGGKALPFTPPAVAELAAKFPQLQILELVGSGGMGAVYRARQKELDRIVALKILPPDIGRDAAFAERFTREAKALAKLNHPGIVTIHDFGRADGLFFFLMEFVDGVNLGQLLHAGRVSPREALAIVPQICDALQYAHDQGIVHRDIKPENILLDRRGRVKVADFGLAKLVGAESGRAGSPLAIHRSPLTAASAPAESGAHGPQHPMSGGMTRPANELTEAGKVMGTPRYMAPEQLAHPGDVDHRADIYALGVVFYQMLTGELPLGTFQPPSQKVQVDVRLDEVVLRALEKEPERRYQQASVLKMEVETIAGTPRQGPGGDREEMERAVKWPAIGLMVSSLLSPVIPVLLIVLREVQPAAWMVWAFALMLVFMAVAISGGFNMLRLNSYRAAIVGGIAAAALAIFNINIIGPPFAGWALFVLTRREVRQAFLNQRRNMQTNSNTTLWRGLCLGIGAACLVGLALWWILPRGNPSQLTQEGWQLWQGGRPAEAIPKFESAVKLDRKNSAAWNGLGWARFNSGKTTEAEKAFQKVIELEPDHPAALNGLGQICLAQKKYAEAESYLLKASPKAPAAWYGLARLYLLQGKFEQAEKWAQNLADSGQADEVARLMLQAARDKKLSEGLRLKIEPQ